MSHSAPRGKRRVPAGGGGKRRGGFDRSVCSDGIYANSRMTHAATSLLGLMVKVHVKNGRVYDGIFKTFSPKMDICLEQAHRLDSGHQQSHHNNTSIPVKECLIEKVIFNLKDIVMIDANNVDMEVVNKDGFVDSSISSSKPNGTSSSQEKELTPWEASSGTVDELESLEDSGSQSQNGWDVQKMFDINKKKFNITSSYDPKLSQYTVPLVPENTLEWRKREEKAQRIAREIENSEHYQKDLALENGADEVDEEMAFSAVHRNDGGDSGPAKYIPPHLRRNTQQGRPVGRSANPQTPPTSATENVNQNVTTPPPIEQQSSESKSQESTKVETIQESKPTADSSTVQQQSRPARPPQSSATVSIIDAPVVMDTKVQPEVAAPNKSEPTRRVSGGKGKDRDTTLKELKEFGTNFKLNKDGEIKKDGQSPVSPKNPRTSPHMQQSDNQQQPNQPATGGSTILNNSNNYHPSQQPPPQGSTQPTHITTANQPPPHVPTSNQPSHHGTSSQQQQPHHVPTSSQQPHHVPTSSQQPHHVPTSSQQPHHVPTSSQQPHHVPTSSQQPHHVTTSNQQHHMTTSSQPPHHITTPNQPHHMNTSNQPPHHITTSHPPPSSHHHQTGSNPTSHPSSQNVSNPSHPPPPSVPQQHHQGPRPTLHQAAMSAAAQHHSNVASLHPQNLPQTQPYHHTSALPQNTQSGGSGGAAGLSQAHYHAPVAQQQHQQHAHHHPQHHPGVLPHQHHLPPPSLHSNSNAQAASQQQHPHTVASPQHHPPPATGGQNVGQISSSPQLHHHPHQSTPPQMAAPAAVHPGGVTPTQPHHVPHNHPTPPPHPLQTVIIQQSAPRQPSPPGPPPQRHMVPPPQHHVTSQQALPTQHQHAPPSQHQQAPPTQVEQQPSQSAEKKEEEDGGAKKSTLNPNAKEFILNPNAKEFVPSKPAGSGPSQGATPPRPTTQSPVMTGQPAVPINQFYPAPLYIQPSLVSTQPPRMATKQRVVPSMVTMPPRPDLQAAMTGQPLVAGQPAMAQTQYLQYIPTTGYPQIMVGSRMMTPVSQTQQQLPQQQAVQAAGSQPGGPQNPPPDGNVYMAGHPHGAHPPPLQPQQPQQPGQQQPGHATVYVSSQPGLINHPTHAAPHHQATPPHSHQQSTTPLHGGGAGGANTHPSPSPIHQQQPHPGPPHQPPPPSHYPVATSASGTPQPYGFPNNGGNSNQPPLQPSPHTPTSPQYPAGYAAYMAHPAAGLANQNIAQTSGPAAVQLQQYPHTQHSTQVTHSHHQQHSHMAQTQAPHHPIMMVQGQPTQLPQTAQYPTGAGHPHMQGTMAASGQPQVQQTPQQIAMNHQAAGAAGMHHQYLQMGSQMAYPQPQ